MFSGSGCKGRMKPAIVCVCVCGCVRGRLGASGLQQTDQVTEE